MKVTQKNFCFFRLVSSIVLWVVRKEKNVERTEKRAQNIWLKIENSPLITRLYSNFNLFLLISSLSIIRFLPYHSNFHYRICVFLKLPVAVADWMTCAKKEKKDCLRMKAREVCNHLTSPKPSASLRILYYLHIHHYPHFTALDCCLCWSSTSGKMENMVSFNSALVAYLVYQSHQSPKWSCEFPSWRSLLCL